MVNCLNCIEDDFITTEHIGGGRTYKADTPILLKGAQYRCSIYAYEGKYFSFFHVDGRKDDSEPWKMLGVASNPPDILFVSDDDYCQVRIFWNKTDVDQYVRIAYWLRPDNSV